MSEEPPGITREEFDAVMKRAAELASRSSEPEPGEVALSDAEVIRIGREVGLEERHVRAALSEVRSGIGGSGLIDRIFGPARVRAVREVPGVLDEILRQVDELFVGDLVLEAVRLGSHTRVYRSPHDFASRFAQKFGGRGTALGSARSVEVTVAAVSPSGAGAGDPPTAQVRVEVESGKRRDSITAGWIVGGAVGLNVGVGFAVIAIIPLTYPIALGLLGGVGLGTFVGGWIFRAFARQSRREILDLRQEAEGVLDRLELGEALAPPQPTWRSWMKRQLRGGRG